MDVLVGASKYTQSEGDWAKAQKEAVYLARAVCEVGVGGRLPGVPGLLAFPHALREIRLQIVGQKYAPAARERALATAGIPSENWPRMVRRYWVFGHEPHVAEAVRWWTEGDRQLAELERVGDRLHSQVSVPVRDDAAIRLTFAEIYRMNDRLASVAAGFAQSVAAASTWLYRLLITVFALIVGLLLLAGWATYIRLFQKIADSEQKYRHLIDTAGEAIFILDGRTAAILDANRKGEQILGGPVEQFTGTVLPLQCLESRENGKVPVAEIAKPDRSETREQLAFRVWRPYRRGVQRERCAGPRRYADRNYSA
ncbi:MAG: PAS domain-containing protein [Ignavibacteriota bacterium]